MADLEKAEGSARNVNSGLSRQSTLAQAVLQYQYGGEDPSPFLRQVGDPAALGLFAFGSTQLVLGFVNIQTRGVTIPNIVVGMSIACGGLVQLLAGMWSFVRGDTFLATAFSSFGAFWISFGIVYVPGSGVFAAYEGKPEDLAQLHNAIAIYLMSWFILTFVLWLGSLRSNVGLSGLLFSLDLMFMSLMIGQYQQDVNWIKAGGWFGIITAGFSYYGAASSLITTQSSYFNVPIPELPKHE